MKNVHKDQVIIEPSSFTSDLFKLGQGMVFGALGGMGASTFCHPFDVVRVHLQLPGTTYKHGGDAAMTILRRDGMVRGLYAGLSAAYLRQWTYGACRLGIYSFLLNKVKDRGEHVSFSQKLLMGATAGGIGSLVGTPAEMSLVRMTADSHSPAHLKRNYTGIVNCLTRVVREEGAHTLFSGATPTILRAMSLSSSLLAVYSEAKPRLYKTGFFKSESSIPLMFTGTMLGSLVGSFVSMPFDVVKTRIQNSNSREGLYRGSLDCAVKSVQREGLLVLWAGFFPAFVKLAPYTCISVILTEQLTKFATGNTAM